MPMNQLIFVLKRQRTLPWVCAILLCQSVLSLHVAAAGTFVWDGSTDANWLTGSNWTNGAAPAVGSDLLFPSGAAHPSNTNNFGTIRLNSLSFPGGGYLINGSAIELTSGMSLTHITQTTTINTDINLDQSQTFSIGGRA